MLLGAFTLIDPVLNFHLEVTDKNQETSVREHQVQIIIIACCKHATYSEINKGKFSAPSSLFHMLFYVSQHPVNHIPEKGDISGHRKPGIHSSFPNHIYDLVPRMSS